MFKLVPSKASIYAEEDYSQEEKKWFTIFADHKRGHDLAIFISKIVTTMLRHYDQDERESDGSKHWEAVKSVLLRKFDLDGVRDINDEMWLQKIFEGSSKLSIAKTKMDFLLIASNSRAFWSCSKTVRNFHRSDKKPRETWADCS